MRAQKMGITAIDQADFVLGEWNQLNQEQVAIVDQKKGIKLRLMWMCTGYSLKANK
jgi:hypothetical protein